MRVLLILLLVFTSFSQQTLTQIQLNAQISGSLQPKGSAFYSVFIPADINPNSVLFATVDVLEDHVEPEVYLSSSVEFPDSQNSDTSCLIDRIGSCTVTNLTVESTTYISVFCIDGCNFTIFVNIQPTIPIRMNSRSKIDFNTSSSGILTFAINDTLSQVTILAEEQDFYASNHFRMLLGIGFIPSENNYSLACIDIGAYRKAIKISQTDLNPNLQYYLMIEAEENTSLYLDTQAYQTGEQGIILPNTTVFDYLNDPQNYTISYKLTDQSVQQPLYIRLKTYSGYGSIRVTHCDQHEFFYYDSDGENQEIRISPKQRLECQQKNMLMIENIVIEVNPVMSTYSFSVGSRESSYTSEVRFAQYQSGALGSGEYTNYTLSLYLQEPANISLSIWSDKGDATFTLSLCENQTQLCDEIKVIKTNGNVVFPYDPSNCTGKCFLQLDVVGGTNESQFSFVYRASGYRMKLDDGSVDIGFISMNEYIYYNLTLTNTTNVKSVTIKVVEYSGQVSLIGSRKITNPKIEDATSSKDVVMNWKEVLTFVGSPQSPIYLSVFGDTEAVYKLTVTANREENTPSIYTELEEQTSNQFTTKGEPILVRYAPSTNPYYLSFYPYTPSCIIYGSSLPLGAECMPFPEQFTGQLYMNITGVVGQALKIIVGSQVFLLYGNNPLFLNCDETCAQIVRVQIQNSTVGVLHSGYGRLQDRSTNRTINNGQITLTCPDNKTVCIYTLSAELNWGQMIVSLASDDISRISWYPQPVSLQNLPKKLVYKLPKGVPTVITIISKIASVDLYANIQMMDREKSHQLALTYPNKTSYDFKVQSDFFKRTSTLEITAALQTELGCFSDNGYCVLAMTVFLNDHCRYAHIVEDEIFVISASSYTMTLQENVKYLMQDISELDYYEYRSPFSSNFTFYIEPLSNCKPLMVYSDEIDYPTDQLNTVSSYHSISLTNQSKAVVGVISDIDCLYNMMVLIDNVTSNHRTLIEGFPETVNLPKNSTSYFYYQSGNNIPFQISGTVSNLPIYVLEVPEAKDPSTFLPKKDQSNYSAPHLPLTIDNSKPTSYMIALVNTFPTNITTSLLITQEGLEVIMVHNRIYQQNMQENSTYRFRYYSANSFLIVFVTSSGSFVVNVESYPNLNITQKINDTSPESSVKVASDGSLKPYWIEIQAQTVGYFSIEVIEIGGEAAPSLSAGLPYFDAFTGNPQTNCYKYKGDPTNNEPIRVSLIYKQQFIKTLEASNATLKSLDLTFSYSFTPSTDKNQTANLINSLNFASGITFSLEQKYGLYTFCFENTADQLLDQPYYVVLASKDLQFLIHSLYFFISDSTVQLDKYELIVTEPKTIIAELMSCQGQTQLTGTSNYSDIMDGVVTEIHNDFKSGPYFAGVVNVSKGYYYIGAKALRPNSSYLLRFSSYNQTQNIVLSEMKMNSNNLKWYGNDSHLIVNIEALECQPHCNLTKYVRYYLYISKNINSLNIRTRCGLSDSNTVQLYEYIQTNLTETNVSFKIPLVNIPSEFALSIRAEAVQIPESREPRGVYYFYNTTQMIQASDIPFDDEWISWQAMILTMIVMLLVLVFFILCICKRYKVGFFRSSRAVEFEVTDFSNNSREPEPEISTERNGDNQIELREVQRREVDDGVAYGEFIDESRI